MLVNVTLLHFPGGSGKTVSKMQGVFNTDKVPVVGDTICFRRDNDWSVPPKEGLITDVRMHGISLRSAAPTDDLQERPRDSTTSLTYFIVAEYTPNV
jgi:hypothetical protein